MSTVLVTRFRPSVTMYFVGEGKDDGNWSHCVWELATTGALGIAPNAPNQTFTSTGFDAGSSSFSLQYVV